MPSVDEVCSTFSLVDVAIEFSDNDLQNLTTYKEYQQHVRPFLSKENPKVPISKLMMLVAAKWRDFSETNQYIQKDNELSDSNDNDKSALIKDNDGGAPDEDDEDDDDEEYEVTRKKRSARIKKSKKAAATAAAAKVPALRIRLGKRKQDSLSTKESEGDEEEEMEEEYDDDEEYEVNKKKRSSSRTKKSSKKGVVTKVPALRIKVGKRKHESSVSSFSFNFRIFFKSENFLRFSNRFPTLDQVIGIGN